jgi:16S rRNA (uracil1498-N3)-methyltransferase
MHRFFIEPGLSLEPDTDIALPEALTHQVGHVLRLRAGARVVLLDDSGWESEVELTQFSRAAVGGRVVARRPVAGEDGTAVTLYACLLKGEKFDWVVQKATELGVRRIVPLMSERTVSGAAKGDRWARIAREAAEQSRRGRLPVVDAPRAWAAGMAEVAGETVALVPWEEAGDPLPAALLARARSGPRTGLIIGPEGGLTAAEVVAAQAAGAVPISLGPRILRAETACISAIGLWMAVSGDWT